MTQITGELFFESTILEIDQVAQILSILFTNKEDNFIGKEKYIYDEVNALYMDVLGIRIILSQNPECLKEFKLEIEDLEYSDFDNSSIKSTYIDFTDRLKSFVIKSEIFNVMN